MRNAPVLITGAGGYIGSALARSIAATRPPRMILLDSSEQNLFNIHTYLAGQPEPPHESILGSVADEALLDDIFRRFQPKLVIHAAAFKHVSLLELNPFAAVCNNALGTYTLARAAREHGAKKLVLVSTDKAVMPHSIMGASKRLAELTISALSGPSCTMNAVRLVNVLDSPGSVGPIFREQIAKGGPVTITHPDATRYFMSLDAAVQAILAGAVAEGSPRILVPESGELVRIADFARALIERSGKADRIPIRFIGLRPGEKIHEDLHYPQEKIPSAAELHACMDRIAAELDHRNLAGLVDAIRLLVPEYAAK